MRKQLRVFSNPPIEVELVGNRSGRSDTTEGNVKVEQNAFLRTVSYLSYGNARSPSGEQSMPGNGTESYNKGRSISITKAVRPSGRPRQNSMEANTAALGYLKCALLFFMSLLITVSVIPTSAHFDVEI
jgi:hypothetical protein